MRYKGSKRESVTGDAEQLTRSLINMIRMKVSEIGCLRCYMLNSIIAINKK